MFRGGGGGNILERWVKCPQCCREFQGHVGIEMAKVMIKRNQEVYLEFMANKINIKGYSHIITLIIGMNYHDDQGLIKEGKRCECHAPC